ncbi:MAG: hypothetical protein VYA17_04790 [Pseudomonadota bacterium]|nr:hypothetical protein [Pseudomonadota bacterium]
MDAWGHDEKNCPKTSPLCNDRKLKLGTYSTNLAFADALATVDVTHKAM